MTLTMVRPWPIYDLDLTQNQMKINWCPGGKMSIFLDLDLDPMTLMLKLDLDMVKMYHHTKNEVSLSTHSKVIAPEQTDTQTLTHRHHENITSTAYAGGNDGNCFHFHAWSCHSCHYWSLYPLQSVCLITGHNESTVLTRDFSKVNLWRWIQPVFGSLFCS